VTNFVKPGVPENEGLVIGGTRFLGYHLTRALLELGIKVTLFNRGISSDDFGDRVTRIKGDRQNHQQFYEQFQGQKYDVVIDLIGYHPLELEVAEKTFRDHIGLYVSSALVRLSGHREQKLAGQGGGFLSTLIPCPSGEELPYEYGMKKRECELLLEERFRSRKFPAVRFRCPVIHGPRDYSLRMYSYLLRIQAAIP